MKSNSLKAVTIALFFAGIAFILSRVYRPPIRQPVNDDTSVISGCRVGLSEKEPWCWPYLQIAGTWREIHDSTNRFSELELRFNPTVQNHVLRFDSENLSMQDSRYPGENYRFELASGQLVRWRNLPDSTILAGQERAVSMPIRVYGDTLFSFGFGPDPFKPCSYARVSKSWIYDSL